MAPADGLSKFGALPTSHRIPDVLAPGLKLVLCGTALGLQSARAKAYYANPSNMFWSALARVGLTPRKFAPQEYPAVTDFGIGLTDLCKHAYGNDNELPAGALDRAVLEEKILRYQPHILAFTSKHGASAYLGKPTGKIDYGFQPERIGTTKIYVLCSPSGHGRRYWREEIWQQLADTVRQL